MDYGYDNSNDFDLDGLDLGQFEYEPTSPRAVRQANHGKENRRYKNQMNDNVFFQSKPSYEHKYDDQFHNDDVENNMHRPTLYRQTSFISRISRQDAERNRRRYGNAESYYPNETFHQPRGDRYQQRHDDHIYGRDGNWEAKYEDHVQDLRQPRIDYSLDRPRQGGEDYKYHIRIFVLNINVLINESLGL